MARIVIEAPGEDEAGFLEFLLEATRHQETIRAVQAGQGYTTADLEALVEYLATHMEDVADLDEARGIVRRASANELGEMMAGIGEDAAAPFDDGSKRSGATSG